MSFLPENYKEPSSNDSYFKPVKDQEARIRILSKPIIGWEDWDLNNKPVRFHYDNKPAAPIQPDKHVRLFWSFIIWNCNTKQIQIWHVTQATIRKAVSELVRDADWGDPYNYDIKVTRRGDGKETEYTINPAPQRPLEEEAIAAFKAKPCNLEAMFDNQDPWTALYEVTPMEGKHSKAVEVEGCISNQQIHQLIKVFEFDESIKSKTMDVLHKKNIQSLNAIPTEMYDSVFKYAFGLREELEKKEKAALDLPF